MGEHVRRMRLLVVVGAVALLAFVAAWPSEGAVTEPPPLYLARQQDAQGIKPEIYTYVAVGDAASLSMHVLADGENLADLEVIDSAGQVVELDPKGDVEPTGRVIDPTQVRSWLHDSFDVRLKALNGQVNASTTIACQSSVQAARDRLTLPGYEGGRQLTLAETFAQAELRLTAMHRPENQIPLMCLRQTPHSGHQAGYLHNLWHRLTGTS